jgi:N6-L-threonylcarbamoyladenine synthase
MILGIESSCDESAIAVVDSTGKVKGEWVHSQIAKHAEYGGVVPDLAVGEHLKNFFPLLELARSELSLPEDIESIAVTCGPGLAGCLGVGISIAKTLSLQWGIPAKGVNHLRGHAFSPFMPLGNIYEIERSKLFPHLGLLISGGNTLLFQIDEHLTIDVLARTVDDAVGECLDKGAKLLGIAYPGAPDLERNAANGGSERFDFPRFISKKNDLRFSFSGLKTSLLYQLKKMTDKEILSSFSDLCASYQKAAFDQLVKTTEMVLREQGYKSFGLSGGVSNNQKIRDDLSELCNQWDTSFLPAQKKYTGDNASMIAYCALLDPKGLMSNEAQQLTFCPNLKICDISI